MFVLLHVCFHKLCKTVRYTIWHLFCIEVLGLLSIDKDTKYKKQVKTVSCKEIKKCSKEIKTKT